MLSKNSLFAALGLTLLSGASMAQDLVISEIVDGTLPGGLPKYVQLTNNSAGTIDLSGFTIGTFNNGGTTLGGMTSKALSGMLAAGDSYTISYENGDTPGVSTFFDTYGCDADDIDLGAFINGDDVVMLFLADGAGPLGEALIDSTGATIHDVYGDLGVDGTGMPWETTDSYGTRIGTAASAVFNVADWNFAGADALEDPGGDDIIELANLLAATDGNCPGGPPVGFPTSCNGDGGNQMGCTNCPCTNNSTPGTPGGCLNSAGTAANLVASGSASVSLPINDTTDLRFELNGAPPSAFCILNSGDGLAPGNMANPCFGLGSGAQAAAFDGLRCAITNTRRHGGRSADAMGNVGVTNNPWGGEGGPPVGIAVAGSGFVSGQTRFFQVINRDDALLSCMRGLNTSQSVEVTFTP